MPSSSGSSQAAEADSLGELSGAQAPSSKRSRMTWPAIISTSLVCISLVVVSSVLWLRYGEGIFVDQMLASLAGCF